MIAHITTWVVSVISAVVLYGVWYYTHPTPRIAVVDINGMFEEQKQKLGAKIKSDMSEQEQKELFQSATEYAGRVEKALTVLSKECKCALMNSAVIVRRPENNASVIPDLTPILRNMVDEPQ